MSRSGLTWSTVRITSSNRVTSPRISVTSLGMAANGDTAPGFRSMHATVSPRLISRLMSRGPMKPVPPITSIAMAPSSAHAHVLHDAPASTPGARPHHVEVAPRVAPDAVTRAEAGIAPLREALALEGQDAHQAAVVLGNVDDVVGVDVEYRRPDQLGRPGVQEGALLVEDLHPVVLPIAHHDAPVPVDPHAVGQVELAGAGAALAPGVQMRAVGGELVHARVAVAVRDEHLARRRDGDVGWQVERPAAVRDLPIRARARLARIDAGV